MSEVIYQIMRWSHIISGFTAIVAFWIPLVTQNGSPVHRRSGWTYTIGMGIVAISAWIMALMRIAGWKESTADQLDFAWFLILIAWLSMSSAWQGLIVLRTRWWQSHSRRLEWVTVIIAMLLMAGSAGLMVHGFAVDNPLLAWFPLVGVNVGAVLLVMLFNRQRQSLRIWRMREHIAGMIGCGISTITAFTVFAVPALLGWAEAPLWLWLTPIAILLPLTFISIRKHASN